MKVVYPNGLPGYASKLPGSDALLPMLHGFCELGDVY
jgi:hypothetical protein